MNSATAKQLASSFEILMNYPKPTSAEVCDGPRRFVLSTAREGPDAVMTLRVEDSTPVRKWTALDIPRIESIQFLESEDAEGNSVRQLTVASDALTLVFEVSDPEVEPLRRCGKNPAHIYPPVPDFPSYPGEPDYPLSDARPGPAPDYPPRGCPSFP